MSSPAIKVEGLNKLTRQMKQLEGDVSGAVKELNGELAGVVADTARRKVPRRSGNLAGSIRSSGQARTGVVRAGGRSVPYANVIHFGWAAHHIRPQPFLYDALDDRRQYVIDRWASELDKLVGKVD
jgi:HK97 gp10 family phage protein